MDYPLTASGKVSALAEAGGDSSRLLYGSSFIRVIDAPASSATVPARRVINVEDFITPQTGADKTAAVQAAINAAKQLSTYETATTVNFNGIHDIYGPVYVDANSIKLKGNIANFGGGVSLKSESAKIAFGGATNRYQCSIEDFIVLGNNVATSMVEFENVGECEIENIMLLSSPSGVGLTLKGNITGILKVSGLQTNSVGNPVRMENNGVVWFENLNLYKSDACFTVVGNTKHINIRDSWFESYNYVCDFDSTLNDVDVFGWRFRDCYFQNTYGGDQKTSRIVRARATNNTFRNRIAGFEITGGNVYHAASSHLIEVAWGGNTAGGINKFHGAVKGIVDTSPAGITAVMTSDVSNSALKFVDVVPERNYHLVEIPFTTSANLIGGPEKFAANTATPSVKTGATMYQTANTAATTITSFADGYPAQEIRVVVKDAFTTFGFSAGGNLSGNNGANYVAAVGDFLRATFDGSKWYCSVTR